MAGRAQAGAVRLLEAVPSLASHWREEANPRALEEVTLGARGLVHLKCAEGHLFSVRPARVAQVPLEDLCPQCKSLAHLRPAFLPYFHEEGQGRGPDETPARGGREGVHFRCPQGHAFKVPNALTFTTVEGLLDRCPGCKSLASRRPEVAARWGVGNPSTPEETSPSQGASVHLLCPEGHDYEANPWGASALACPSCGGGSLVEVHGDLIATHWDFEKNEADPHLLLPQAQGRYFFKCPRGHRFSRHLASLKERKRDFCPQCRLEGHSFAALHPTLASLWDEEANGKKAEEVYAGAGGEWWFSCPGGHRYRTSLRNVVKRGGCGICLSQTSSLEIKVHNFLREHLPANEVELNKCTVIPPYKIDILIPGLRLALEVNGDLWHSDAMVRDKTSFESGAAYHTMKAQRALGAGITLAFIWSHDWFAHEEETQEALKDFIATGLVGAPLDKLTSHLDESCQLCSSFSSS